MRGCVVGLCENVLSLRLQALMQQAGTYVGKSGIAGRDSFPVDPVKWEAFRGWFVKGLKTLQLVRSTPAPGCCL